MIIEKIKADIGDLWAGDMFGSADIDDLYSLIDHISKDYILIKRSDLVAGTILSQATEWISSTLPNSYSKQLRNNQMEDKVQELINLNKQITGAGHSNMGQFIDVAIEVMPKIEELIEDMEK